MGKVVHFEIPTDQPEKSMDFYKNVFGWKFTQFGEESYWLADTGPADQMGINGAIMKRNHPQQPVTNSIGVANLDTAIAEIEKNGGSVVVPKTVVPGVGYMAFFKDPDQNIMGVWQPDNSAK